MKILTLNTWQEKGPWERRWEIILESLKSLKPDIICFQEVFNPKWVKEVMRRSQYPFSVFTRESSVSGLFILSKYRVARELCRTYRIKSRTEDYLRYGLFAELNVCRERLAVVNTHLSWKLNEGFIREAQVRDLIQFCDREAGRLETLICGDFNAVPGSFEVRPMIRQGGFEDLYAVKYPVSKSVTWDNRNPYAASASVKLPDRRIDLIFARNRGKLLNRLADIRIVLNQSKEAIFASDHYGVLATFEDRKA